MFIWENREQIHSINDITQSDAFNQCCLQYLNWKFLIEEAVQDMYCDLQEFQSHAYLVIDDQIGYISNDQVDFQIIYGYKTLFAYCKEFKAGRISEQSLNQNLSLNINCGNFSFAEIPKQFDYLLGVSGTLKDLSKPQRDIIEKQFSINCFTYVPSVFGDNKRIVEKSIKVESSDDYFNAINDEIENRLIGQMPDTMRSVLCFFQDRDSLDKFYQSDAFKNNKEQAQILTEETSLSEKDRIIKYSTVSGYITLSTKCFGRGTDFISRDLIVISNGGVHVIITFLPEQPSQEAQIKGRTARQGQEGSVSMILQKSQLEKYLILPQDYEKQPQIEYYSIFNEKRNKYFERKYESNKEFNRIVREENAKSVQYRDDLYDNNLIGIQDYLQKVNIGRSLDISLNISQTLVLMDATGSMSGLLQQAKNSVGIMFQRAIKVLQDRKIDPNCFQLQFAVYRDYDCLIQGLFVNSGWETQPEILRQFMDTCVAQGGQDFPQAIQIGLWHANQLHQKQEISQVILIGDAPAKSEEQIKCYRAKYKGESYWAASQFGSPVHYQSEMHKLRDSKIPVHAFHIGDRCKLNFAEIASCTGGICAPLDIDSIKGSEELTNLVTEGILSSIGKIKGKGDELLQRYQELFKKGVRD